MAVVSLWYVAPEYWETGYADGDGFYQLNAEIQKAAPSAIIELFELQLNATQHGVSETYRFHAGANKNGNGELVWNGNIYLRFPVEADGFEYSGNGQLPRPKIRCSNIFGTITAILLGLPSGLEGAKVTRIRTLARYLDAINFPGGVNPYGTPDPTAEWPREIYYIDRKSAETRDVVEFELAAAFDLAGVRAPKRQCIANICQWRYRSAECGYAPVTSFSGTYSRKTLAATYTRSSTAITVTSTAHGIAAGDRVWISSLKIASGTYSQTVASANELTVTCTAHGYGAGSVVSLAFTSGATPPANGEFTVKSATTNKFIVEAPLTETNRSGNVTVSAVAANGAFYNVATATTNSFTVASNSEGDDSGTVSVSWLKVSATGHGLSAGNNVYLNFTSGGATTVDGSFAVGSASANDFTVSITSGATTSGNVTATQWYDADDSPVYALASDTCAKRLSSCKQRFGANSELPFGSYPGIGVYSA